MDVIFDGVLLYFDVIVCCSYPLELNDNINLSCNVQEGFSENIDAIADVLL